MITAVILARCDSSRLPKKHFLKIGNKSLIKLIINNLEKNILILTRLLFEQMLHPSYSHE